MTVTDANAQRNGDVVLGDDWVAPDGVVEKDLHASRVGRGWMPQRGSPLTRKIITFNLIALNILVAGILYLNASRDGLAAQRAAALVVEAELIADVFEAQLPSDVPITLATGDGVNIERTLAGLDLRSGVDVFVYDLEFALIGQARGMPLDSDTTAQATGITDLLNKSWEGLSRVFAPRESSAQQRFDEDVAQVASRSMESGTLVDTGEAVDGSTIFTVASPIERAADVVGSVVIVSASGEIDALVRSERERVLQMFVIATIVSIGLSLVLASTISNPISDLADAAELGRERDRGQPTGGRVRIPDLTARPDEIGRLSGALRGMVNALYDRIESNEQFAADVAHEIKNPLASLRSAVGTMRVAKRDDQREKLLSVIEHDVRRLDRLVSDISNASRLDSELVKEEQSEFDLLKMLENLGQFLGEDAQKKGIEFISDLPTTPVRVHGLEARLAQVFVNLISNAISFCEDGDAIRIWARQRESRVLVVVEDTGPGIPEEALGKVFKRFYSQRPESDFGNNSGLGLAISKQIVEAHGGVIWAENIRPTEADITSEPLGARFVVGLPV